MFPFQKWTKKSVRNINLYTIRSIHNDLDKGESNSESQNIGQLSTVGRLKSAIIIRNGYKLPFHTIPTHVELGLDLKSTEFENFSCILSQPIYVALYLTQLIDAECSAYKRHNYDDPTDNNYDTNLLETTRRNLSVRKTKTSIVTSEQIISLCKLYSDSQDILV
ncbi:hypothetical protein KUTeg_001813 [Tegillarca granosa]|uniref:Uncharacterized protein n=1 Tax=Tegillarca granosa TaxID=220873 RepID=A0ABQ9FSI3_TEGGR|nr:hypothetical protein KUTeg_001813 [Tegillarca granosa]